MNGKQAKQLRKIAKIKAHSYNETTFEGTYQRKVPFPMIPNSRELSFIKHKDEWVFVQRKLHSFSVRSMVKKFKSMFKSFNHQKKYMFIHSNLNHFLLYYPERFGLDIATCKS